MTEQRFTSLLIGMRALARTLIRPPGEYQMRLAVWVRALIEELSRQ